MQFLPAHVMFFTDNYAKFPTRPLIICVIRTCKLRKGTGMSFMANSGSNMCRLHKTTHVLEWVKTLVYIFTDKENLIDNLTYQVPVGKSDHCCLQFDYILQTTENIFFGNKLNYHKGNYAEILKDLGGIDSDNSLEGKDTEEMWEVIKDTIMATNKKNVLIKNDKHTGSKHKDKWISCRTIKDVVVACCCCCLLQTTLSCQVTNTSIDKEIKQEAQLSLTNRAMLVCKVVEVCMQDFLSEYLDKKFTYI